MRYKSPETLRTGPSQISNFHPLCLTTHHHHYWPLSHNTMAAILNTAARALGGFDRFWPVRKRRCPYGPAELLRGDAIDESTPSCFPGPASAIANAAIVMEHVRRNKGCRLSGCMSVYIVSDLPRRYTVWHNGNAKNLRRASDLGYTTQAVDLSFYIANGYEGADGSFVRVRRRDGQSSGFKSADGAVESGEGDKVVVVLGPLRSN